jgi:nicotinic acid mononucleotide adenylyltransferase
MSAAAEDTSGDGIVLSSDSAYFTFGRFQPPTLGHRLLFEELIGIAKPSGAAAAAAAAADIYVFVSSTNDKDKNPLSVEQKIFWLKRINSDLPIRFINTTAYNCKTPVQAIYVLKEAGYKNITMAVGSDRVEGFGRMVRSMKGLEDVTVTVKAVGEARNNSKNTIQGMSGTKMRNAAVRGNLNSLKRGTGLSNANAATLQKQIKNGKGISGGRWKTRRNKRRSSRSR